MNRVYLTESEDGKKSLCLKLYNLFGVEPFKMCFNITNFKEATYLDILKRIDQFNYNTTKNLLTKTIVNLQGKLKGYETKTFTAAKTASKAFTTANTGD